jgi:hypothetical protein
MHLPLIKRQEVQMMCKYMALQRAMSVGYGPVKGLFEVGNDLDI